jgi:septum formation protein
VTESGDTDRTLTSVVLASASPRRQELLRQIGLPYVVVVPSVDETPRSGEPADDFVTRLALDKACQGKSLAAERGLATLPVLGADTCIVLDREILGKPLDRDDGIAMLQRLAGRSHEVLTGIAVVRQEIQHVAISRNKVTFGPMSDREITAYWDTGEPADKAGAYALQGKAAAYIERIEGSYSAIVGLPLFELTQILKTLGIRCE